MLSPQKCIGLPGYSVTPDGQLFHGEHKLRAFTDRDGYTQVNVTHQGKSHHYKIHRLVAQAYIPNPDNLPEVNHKDGDKSNNQVGNLEWCTHKENLRHAAKMKLFRYGEAHQNSSLLQAQADEIRELFAQGSWNQKQLAEKFGVSPMVVSRIVRGLTYVTDRKEETHDPT